MTGGAALGPELRRLRRVTRGAVRERSLVCPECGGAIVLAEWRYWCDGPIVNGEHRPSCGFVSASLAPLRAVERGAHG